MYMAITKGKCPLYFINISNILADVFGKKLAIGAGVYIFHQWVHHFCTENGIPLGHYLCKFLFDILIGA